MTAMYPDSKSCASAFIFSVYSSSTGYSLPSGINNRTSHVPAVLSWNSTYCGEGGCGNLITIFGNETNSLIGGFLQPSCRINNKTSSIVSCPLTIPKGLSSFFASMSNMVDSSDYKRKRSCGFVSLASYDSFFTDDFDLSNRTHVPMQLQWGTLIYGECYLNDSSDTSCILEGDYCWSRLSSTHLCVCSKDTSDITYSRSCKGMS
ncbi:hypothetical protein Gotur_008453 [Gossypium turneri]